MEADWFPGIAPFAGPTGPTGHQSSEGHRSWTLKDSLDRRVDPASVAFVAVVAFASVAGGLLVDPAVKREMGRNFGSLD